MKFSDIVLISRNFDYGQKEYATEEGEDHSIVEVVYNTPEGEFIDIDYNSIDTDTIMDPQYDYHNHPYRQHHRHVSDSYAAAKSVTSVHDQNSTITTSNEDIDRTSRDCSTIISECFSGEDTAEVGMMMTTTDPSKSQQQGPPQQAHDVSVVDATDNDTQQQVVPSPIRYFIDNDLIEKSNPSQQQQQYYDNVRVVNNNTPTSSPNRSFTTPPTTTGTNLMSVSSTMNRSPIRDTHTTKINEVDPSHHLKTIESKHTTNNASIGTFISGGTKMQSPTTIDSFSGGNSDDTRLTSQPHQVDHTPTAEKSNYMVRSTNGKSNGATDLDDEDDEDEQELSWRMCPSKSMSDWTIEIRITTTTTTDIGTGTTINESDNVLSSLLSNHRIATYHVHKSVLAVGPRRSQYFVKMFRSIASSSDSKYNTTNTTKMEMEELTANAFPILLDYMYRPSSHNNRETTTTPMLPITTENATALHILAERLEMKHLRTIVRNFWMQDLCMDNIAIYYQHASSSKLYNQQLARSNITTDGQGRFRVGGGGGGLDDPLIIRALEMYCAQHLFDTSGNCTIADILDLIDPQFLYNVIGLAHNNNEKLEYNGSSNTNHDSDKDAFSLRLSLIVAVYCNLHYELDLDASMFHLLTDAQHLPVLESQAAKAFLELQEKLLGVPNTTITSLTERCITVLAKNWDNVCIKQDMKTDRKSVTLPRLECSALETFVAEAFLNAAERIGQTEVAYNEEKSKTVDLDRQVLHEKRKNDSLQHENKELQQQLRELQQEMDSMKQRISMTNKIQQLSNGTNKIIHNSGSNFGESVPEEENMINGVIVDDHDDTSTIETINSFSNDNVLSVPQQQAQQHRSTSRSSASITTGTSNQITTSAIDHGRQLLQRLDTTTSVPSQHTTK